MAPPGARPSRCSSTGAVLHLTASLPSARLRTGRCRPIGCPGKSIISAHLAVLSKAERFVFICGIDIISVGWLVSCLLIAPLSFSVSHGRGMWGGFIFVRTFYCLFLNDSNLNLMKDSDSLIILVNSMM